MSLVVGVLAGVGILLWPERFHQRSISILRRVSWSRPRPDSPKGSATPVALSSLPGPVPGWVKRFVAGSATGWIRRCLPGRAVVGVNAGDLLSLLEAIAPALEAGMAPASALRIAAESRSGAGEPDPLSTLAGELASAAAEGAQLGPLWRDAAESTGSGELLLLSQAWSLTEDLGVPLAQAVRTAAGLLEARLAHERRLAGAVAGPNATVNVLMVLPLGGPLLGLMLGIGPAELYGGARLTQGSLLLGLLLVGIGRLWVNRMVRAVARGPVIS